ncbi:MAG: PUA domain-containing protein [Candidatus Caldarchaeales archaeon]
MKASYLSKTESAKLLKKIKDNKYFSNIIDDKVKTVFMIEIEGISIYKIGRLVLLEKSEVFFPTLKEEFSGRILDNLPYIVVDMGAVSHIANGADVMRPGVREVHGELKKNNVLVVRDEKNRKPIAIVKALVDYEEFNIMVKGKVAENIHYVNDRIWNFLGEVANLLER